MGYELGEKAYEVEEDDDGAVEVGWVSPPPLTSLQSCLPSLHLPNCPLEHLTNLGVSLFKHIPPEPNGVDYVQAV